MNNIPLTGTCINFSEQNGTMLGIMLAIQADLEPLIANRENKHFKSWYADLSAVLELLLPKFRKHGILLFQTSAYERENNLIRVSTFLTHVESGEFLKFIMDLPIDRHTVQGLGSVTTYGRRYSLMLLAGLATEEDDDGNVASNQSGKRTVSNQSGKRTVKEESLLSEEQLTKLTELADKIYGDNLDEDGLAQWASGNKVTQFSKLTVSQGKKLMRKLLDKLPKEEPEKESKQG